MKADRESARPFRPPGLRRRALVPLALFAGGLLLLPPLPGAGEDDLFRLGFTRAMLAEVNENDTRAALRAIATIVARERGIRADPEPLLFTGTDEVAQSVRARTVDAVAMTMDEYWALAGHVRFSRFLLAGFGPDPREEYLILVRKDRGFTQLAELQDRRLNVHATPRMRVGFHWLEVLAARAGLPPADRIFTRTLRTPKLSKVVLDVYFKQADACLVTRHGFDTMREMNPEVGRQLTILAASPRLVPALFALHADRPAEYLDRIVRDFKGVQDTAAGRQALTIFQVGDLTEQPASALDETLALLTEYQALRPEDSARLIAALRQGHPAVAEGVNP